MARPKKPSGPSIFWRKGRAYADFRAYAAEGGGREALSEPGRTWGTQDPQTAEALFAKRLAELQAKRMGRATGQPERATYGLAKLVQLHLVRKEKAGTTTSHMKDLQHRLEHAVMHFGAARDPGTIEPSDVREWAEALADGTRKPGTVRHYLNALSGLYGRAQEVLCVPPAYNPVSMLQEKPTGHRKAEAAFFEVPDAALLLEAARITDRGERGWHATPGFYPIVATFLLTGGRSAEVLGLDVEDVSFDRGIVRFRPNAHRRLKTSTSHRDVPLFPQLREILQEWMFGGESPRTGGLLFPGTNGGMVGDLRKSLDAIGGMCGFDDGEVRTRRFRHTFCSAALQVSQRILRPGRDPSDPDSYEWTQVTQFTVQKWMGHGGAQLVNRIYGHAQRSPYRSEVVEYRVEKHHEQLGERLTALRAI